jgi:hypothetical protein
MTRSSDAQCNPKCLPGRHRHHARRASPQYTLLAKRSAASEAFRIEPACRERSIGSRLSRWWRFVGCSPWPLEVGQAAMSQPDPTKRHGDHPRGGGLRCVRSSARRPRSQIATSSVDATAALRLGRRGTPPGDCHRGSVERRPARSDRSVPEVFVPPGKRASQPRGTF